MLGGDHLTLRQVRLEPSKEWVLDQEGLLFLFPLRGCGKLYFAGVQEPVTPAEVILVNGLGGGRLRTGDGAELVFSFFTLLLEHLYPLFDGREISQLHQVADGLNGFKKLAASHRIAQACHQLLKEAPPKFDLTHRSQLLRVVALVLAEEFNTASRQRAGYMGTEASLIHVFESLNPEDLANLPLSDLAKRFSCSRRHLNRLFHQYFGFSVASLRMEMRLLKAVSLLRNSEAKIINVAEECGFNHLGLFNTCFKRRFGSSPGQWRKTVIQPQTVAAHPPGEGLLCPLRSTGLCPSLGGGPPRDEGTANARPPSASGMKAGLKKPLALDAHPGNPTLSIPELRRELLDRDSYRASA
jgi:AraC-like DNA-binding protein